MWSKRFDMLNIGSVYNWIFWLQKVADLAKNPNCKQTLESIVNWPLLPEQGASGKISHLFIADCRV